MGNGGVNNIRAESYPLFFVTGLIGLRPFRVWKTRFFGYLYSAIVATAYGALYLWTITETYDFYEEMRAVSTIMRFRIIQAFANIFIVALTIIWSVAQCGKLGRMYDELCDIDEKLKLLNVRFDYAKAMKRDFFHLLDVILYTVMFNLLEYFPLIGPETKRFFGVIWLANSIPQFVNSLAVASFVVVMRKIRRRLEAINEYIPRLMSVEKSAVGGLEIEVNNVFRLRLVNRIHENLVVAATMLNDCHGLLILTSFVVYFLSACSHSRTIYLVVGIKTQLVDFLVEALWLIFYLAKYFYVIDVCHGVAQQVKLSGQLLRDKWTDVEHHPLKREAEAIARRVESRDIQLTACNFFVIDYSTLRKIVVGLAAYIFLVAHFADVSLAAGKKQM